MFRRIERLAARLGAWLTEPLCCRGCARPVVLPPGEGLGMEGVR
jgi:hypothetical protein